MKTFIRFITLILVFSMLLSCFIGCKAKEDSRDESTATNGVVSTVDTKSEYISKLPEMDFGAEECLILGRDDSSGIQMRNFEIYRESLPDDVVGKAVWERNDMLKQKYNFIVTQDLVSNTAVTAGLTYTSNEDLYDIVMYVPVNGFAHSQDGYLLDLSATQYIDLEHPSWDDYINGQMSFGNSLYATANDFCLEDKNRTYIIFYNREMARDAGLGYFEDMVKAGTWTLDNYNTIARQFRDDADGDGRYGTKNDSFGVVCESQGSFSTFLCGAGFRTSVVKDGKIELVGAGDQILNIIDRVGKFMFDSEVAVYAESFTPLDMYRPREIFLDERAMFYSCFFSEIEAGLAENCNFEYSFLPFPKYDENQPEYYTSMDHRNGTVVSIPKTVLDPSVSGFFLEALTEASTDTSLFAYIETKCKLQDSYDQRASDMVGVIFENVVYDIVQVCDFGKLFRAILTEIPAMKKNNYSNLYGKRYENAINEIEEAMENLNVN